MSNKIPLPSDFQIQFAELTPADSWLENYITYSKQRTPMAPHAFHLSAGLAILSTIVARRVVVNTWYGDRYPNLFIMWIAPSTIFKKTSTLDTSLHILRAEWPHFLAPANTTPEALVESMAGGKPSNFDELSPAEQTSWQKEANYAGQKAFLVDECSGFLGSTKRDYNQGLVEILLTLYDCTPEYRRQTRSKGREIIRDAYLTFLGASTPHMMASFIANPLYWNNGLLPRFLFALTPQEKPPFSLGNNKHDINKLLPHLKQLDQKLPQRTSADKEAFIKFEMAKEATDLLQRYYQFASYDAIDPKDNNEGLMAAYGRLHEHVLKVATLLATSDWTAMEASEPFILEKHIILAIQIMEEFRTNLHTLVDKAQVDKNQHLDQKVIDCITRAGSWGITHRDLYKNYSLPADETRAALDRLTESGRVHPISRGPGNNGGRPTTYYQLANSA